jgi:glutathione S-transferase
MLTVHHLGKSQSERIVWLCEELAIAYELKHYTRDAVTNLSPPELKALHPLGAAPVITDGDVLLAESGAVVDYIIARHGGGRLTLAPAHPDFVQYLYWLHFANGNLQPIMGRNMLVGRLNLQADHPMAVAMRGRLRLALELMEARLAEATWLAGEEFTAADIMTVFSLTTMRNFSPVDLSPYPNILAYLQRVAARPAYQSAMAKGDPGMPLLLT